MFIYGIAKKLVITVTRNELAQKMMYEEFNGKRLLKSPDEEDPDFGYHGDNFNPQRTFTDPLGGFSVDISKTDDSRWWNESVYEYASENIGFEVLHWTERNKLQFFATHKKLLTVDKRALYTLVVEIMTEVGGEISEDDQKTWISLDEFKTRHQEVLSLSYEEANEISLKEAPTFDSERENFDDDDLETPEEYAARGWDWEWSNAEHEEDDGPTSNKKI